MASNSSPTGIDPHALAAVGRFMAQRRVYGIVWINPELIVTAKFGEKADFIAVGQPITDSVIPFIGSEDTIAALRADPTQSFELPGVVIVTSAESQERYNLSLFWSPDDACYLLLVARASMDAALEIELLRHVRARLMAEAEIKAKSYELARANKDLEDFAAIISHDLKAPMRALKYTADDVGETLKRYTDDAGLDAVATRVAWIGSQSRRMSSMLSSLLDYSTIGRKHRAVEEVDTRELVVAIVNSLPRPPTFTIGVSGTWPVIQTLKAPLDLVIRNLVDNALKHHDSGVGRVEVSCSATDDALHITVADDGPGIHPDHAQAVFLPFRTLATGDTAPTAGIGMGLALVERTVSSVGGSITLTPRTADVRGASLVVAWPRVLTL